MGSLTNFAEMELLDHVLNAAYSTGGTMYLALCTADPGEAATGASCNEVSNSNNYARKSISFGAPSSRVVTQDADVTENAPSGSWGTISHWAIVTSATYGAGNCLAYGAFPAAKAITSNNAPVVPSGTIAITFSAGHVSTYLANKLLGLMFDATAYARPAITYVALCSSALADSDTDITAKELSGSGYSRVPVYPNGTSGYHPTWDTAVSGAPSYVDNTDAITFATATANWSTVTGWAICDAETGGNLLFYSDDLSDATVSSTETAEFAAGACKVTLD